MGVLCVCVYCVKEKNAAARPFQIYWTFVYSRHVDATNKIKKKRRDQMCTTNGCSTFPWTLYKTCFMHIFFLLVIHIFKHTTSLSQATLILVLPLLEYNKRSNGIDHNYAHTPLNGCWIEKRCWLNRLDRTKTHFTREKKKTTSNSL